MRAIQIEQFGGPEVLKVAELPDPEPAADEVLVRVERAGVNFADTHTRENSYVQRFELPLVPGGEVAGTVARAANGFEEGRRVIGMIPSGGYAELAAVPATALFPLPDELDHDRALALLIQGLTAWHLIRTTAKVEAGETVVVISGAGGVGSLAIQLAKPFGAGRVIATASSEEKRALCLDLGADAAVDPGEQDLAGALRAANEGERLDVVFEMAGGRIFDACFDALAPFGRLVAYGIAGREGNSVRTGALLGSSRSVMGFYLGHLLRRPERLRESLQDLFSRAASGELRVVVGGVYPLADAPRAHEDLQGRRTTGKLLLDPTAP